MSPFLLLLIIGGPSHLSILEIFPNLLFPVVTTSAPIASALIYMTYKSTLLCRPDIAFQFHISVFNCLLVIPTRISQKHFTLDT